MDSQKLWLANRISKELIEMNQFLTIRQVAEILQINLQTAYGWTYRGKLPFVKINGIVRIPRDEFEGLLNKQPKRIK